MKLKLIRHYNGNGYTIGRLYVDGNPFCDTLEDTDRGLNSKMSLKEIKANKVYGKTAIPKGLYVVDMHTKSPRLKERWWAKMFGGIIPRLKAVKGFDGVLIHPGNTAYDTEGCVLVGRNTVVDGLTASSATYVELVTKMVEANKRGEEITLEIA